MLYSKAQTHLAIWNWILSTNQIKCTLYQRIQPRMVGTLAPSASTSGPSLAGVFLGHQGCLLVHFLSPASKDRVFLQTLTLSQAAALPMAQTIEWSAKELHFWSKTAVQNNNSTVYIHHHLFSFMEQFKSKAQVPNSYLFGFCLCFLLFLCRGGICRSHSSSCRHLLLLMFFVFLVLFILFMLLILLFLLLLPTPFLIWIL